MKWSLAEFEPPPDAAYYNAMGLKDLKKALAAPRYEGTAKNVVFFVGDGLGVATHTMSRCCSSCCDICFFSPACLCTCCCCWPHIQGTGSTRARRWAAREEERKPAWSGRTGTTAGSSR